MGKKRAYTPTIPQIIMRDEMRLAYGFVPDLTAKSRDGRPLHVSELLTEEIGPPTAEVLREVEQRVWAIIDDAALQLSLAQWAVVQEMMQTAMRQGYEWGGGGAG